MSVALITGASRGIGRAIALRLAANGHDMFLTAREEVHLHEVVGEVEAVGGRACAFGIDFSLPDAGERTAAAFTDSFDGLDVLVNNAGVALARDIGEYTAADWDLVMNVNVRTPIYLTQALLPVLRAGEPGVIVNVGSIVAKKGYAKQALYTASKHALLGFTKSLAKESAADGIRVHVIHPGGVNTEMITGVRPDIETSELIDPDEIAKVVIDLVTMRGNAVIDEIEIRRRTKEPWV